MGHPCSGRRQIDCLIYLIKKMTKTMSQKRRARDAQKTRAQPNKNSGVRMVPSAPVRTRGVVMPPDSILRNRQDVVPMRLRATTGLLNWVDYPPGTTPPGGVACLALALTPERILTDGYRSLGYMFPVLDNIKNSFSEYFITRLIVNVKPVTALTSHGFVAFCYEGDDTSRTAPPTNIVNASTGAHSGMATPSVDASISLNCADYRNNWLSTESGNDAGQAGVLQFYGENGAARNEVVALITVEVDVVFTGLRA